jgi:hypothetical protein
MTLNNTDDLHKEDEIRIHQRGRMHISMQSMWNCIGYQTYPATDPHVVLANEVETSSVWWSIIE